MDKAHPTAGWEAVGDTFYRKIQLYTAVLDLDLDLDDYIVAGAPYGGSIGKPAHNSSQARVGFLTDAHQLCTVTLIRS
jgi:hypothetical protein